MSNLAEFRKEKDTFMREPDSPLTADDRTSFSGLKYFAEDPALVFDLPLDGNVPHDPIAMATSTGGQRLYKRAGRISFTIDGAEVELNIYQDEHGYFLPFRDETSGQESYPTGRYLEPEQGSDGKLHVDFNYAYNPHCVYSPHFSCPLPPLENWLKVPIRAGEKIFHP